MRRPWCVEAGRPQQVAKTRWFTRRSVLEAAAHVCAYSDGYVQSLVRLRSHPWLRYQGRDHIAEERWRACLGDDYRPITLLNTELKILTQVSANRLQVVISDLIGPEQTFVLKGRSIQYNLHLIREVLEGIKDGREAALISLDQSKAYDRVDHQFLATVLETAGFQPVFCRWISMMYHSTQTVVQVNGRRLTKAKVCGSMLGEVAIPFQGPSAGVTDPSASSGCGSSLTSNRSEIGRKYKLRWMLRWEPGFQGGCP